MADPNDIIAGSAMLSVVHALIPNHWLPIVAIARAESWSQRHALIITAAAAIAHVSGTIAVGFAVGFLGMEIADTFEGAAALLSSLILIVCGGYFLIQGLLHARTCTHHRLRLVGGGPEEHTSWSRLGVVFSLSMAMFLSPCLEITTFFFSAALHGWSAMVWVSAVFALVTVPVMVLLVALGMHGVEKLNWNILDHHGRTITGFVLVLLGVFRFWIE